MSAGIKPSSLSHLTLQPISTHIPFDVLYMIISHLDWYTLQSFSLANREHQGWINQKLWKSVTVDISLRNASPDPQRRCITLNEFCTFFDRDDGPACHVQNLTMVLGASYDGGAGPLMMSEWDVATDEQSDMLCDALMCFTNLKSLYFSARSDGIRTPSADFPFQLTTLTTQLSLGGLTDFLASQPSISVLKILDAKSDTTIPPHILPNLRDVSIPLQLVPTFLRGRPINNLHITTPLTPHNNEEFMETMQASSPSSTITNLWLGFVFPHISDILPSIIPHFPALRSLHAAAHYWPTRAMRIATRDERIGQTTQLLAELRVLETFTLQAHIIPLWWQSEFLRSTLNVHPCEALRTVEFGSSGGIDFETWRYRRQLEGWAIEASS